MINLLPPQFKEELEQEKTYKSVLILGILFWLFLFCLALTILSIKSFNAARVEEQKILFQQKEEELEAPGTQDIGEKIKTAEQKLSKLNSFYKNQIIITPLIEQLAEILPQEIYLTGLSFNWVQVSLSGFSPTREALFEFKENLQAQENFGPPDIPLISWVKPLDVDFTLSFKIIK